MNIIEKLESFQQQLIGVGQTAAACDLQNIIEEYKNAQDEVVLLKVDKFGECKFTMLDAFDEGRYKLFTHPPLSDETVKDAERYRWLREQNWDLSELSVVVNPKVAVKLGHDCPSLNRLDIAIDEAMKADK